MYRLFSVLEEKLFSENNNNNEHKYRIIHTIS